MIYRAYTVLESIQVAEKGEIMTVQGITNSTVHMLSTNRKRAKNFFDFCNFFWNSFVTSSKFEFFAFSDVFKTGAASKVGS